MTYPPPGGQDPYQPQQPEPSNPYAQPDPQQPYGAPYGQPATPAPSGNNGLSLASMITGIVSVVLGCCCPLLGVPAGGAAIGLGIVGLKQTRERGQAGRGMAIAGIATGVAGLVLAVISFILGASGVMEDWISDLSPGTTSGNGFDD